MIDLARLRQTDFPLPAVTRTIERGALGVGIAGALGCVVGAVLAAPQAFLRAYLVGYMTWFGVTMGCMAVLMVAHITTAQWGFVVRRILEAASLNIFMMALLFVPVLVGAPKLYLWAQAEAVARDVMLQHQQPYLNLTAFVLRAVLYFAVWCFLAYLLNRLSWLQDQPPDKELRVRFQNLSGMGLLLYGFTMTFASIDWIMSLDPHWRSTIYGFYVIAGQGLMGFAFLIVVTALLIRHQPLSDLVSEEHLHDFGKMMFAFVILWAYMAFSQGLIYWSGNLPEEITWYVDRTTGAWWIVGLILLVGHFLIPFVLLLGQDIKRHAWKIAPLALWLMVMRWLDLYWLIIPNFPDTKGHFEFGSLILAVVATLGIGGLWLVVFFYNLKLRPLVVRHDPMLAQMVEEQQHGH